MSDSIKVSDEFMDFYGKEADAIAAAQQAEASSGNVPFDIGTSGVCIVKSIEFGKQPDKEVDDPNNKDLKITKKGHPVITMVFTVVDHKDHSGETFQKRWYLWTNDTTSRVDNYKRFLDECEKHMGLPRELRTDPTFTPQTLAKFFVEGGVTIAWRTVENAKNTYDGGKQIYLSMPKEVIPDSAGVVPSKTTTSAPASTTSPNVSSGGYKIGDAVKYLEMDWKVEAVMPGNKVVLTAPGVESKIVSVDKLGNA